MRKSLTTLALLALSTILLANAGAQTTAAKPKTTTPAQKPATAAKTTAKPAAKPAAKTAGTATTLKTEKEKFSYAVGMSIGSSMRKQGASEETDAAIVALGLKDALSGSKTALTEAEAKAILTAFQQAAIKKEQDKQLQAAAANKKEGETFLAANKAKEGVVTLPSGLQYKIITNGTGPKPTDKDTVVCNYKGTLLNGKEFDSSYKRNEPATFEVAQVIPGFREALQLMPVGSKWQVWIPSNLAYGDRQAGPDILPGSTLAFELELISIQAPKPDAPSAKPQAEAPKAEAPKTEAQPAKNEAQPAKQ